MRRSAAHIPILFALALGAGSGAAAQSRTTNERETLLDLAFAMGESHAYRQACNGAGDQFWRNRMLRLVSVEAGDAGLEARLKSTFNSGYLGAQRTARCGDPAGAAAARRGARLAAELAR